MEAYKTAAGAVGVEDVSPVYVGVGVLAASGVLLLTCGCCAGTKKPKPPSGRGKKSKGKGKSAASMANGSSAHKNGGGRGGGGAAGAVANGGAGKQQPKVGDGSAGGPPAAGAKPVKPAKKAAPKAPQAQGKGKGKGKPVPEAPPVITVRWERLPSFNTRTHTHTQRHTSLGWFHLQVTKTKPGSALPSCVQYLFETAGSVRLAFVSRLAKSIRFLFAGPAVCRREHAVTGFISASNVVIIRALAPDLCLQRLSFFSPQRMPLL